MDTEKFLVEGFLPVLHYVRLKLNFNGRIWTLTLMWLSTLLHAKRMCKRESNASNTYCIKELYCPPFSIRCKILVTLSIILRDGRSLVSYVTRRVRCGMYD